MIEKAKKSLLTIGVMPILLIDYGVSLKQKVVNIETHRNH